MVLTNSSAWQLATGATMNTISVRSSSYPVGCRLTLKNQAGDYVGKSEHSAERSAMAK